MNPADTIRAIWDEVDWDSLYRQLTIYAFALAREMPTVFDGVSADDLVGEAVLTFWEDPSSLGWDPTQAGLDRFLCGVLKKKFLTHARRSWRREGVVEGDKFPRMVSVSAASNGLADETILEKVQSLVRGDTDLEELIVAYREIDSGSNINEKLSARLSTTVADIVNRKKRLIRRLKATAPQGRNCVHGQSKFQP